MNINLKQFSTTKKIRNSEYSTAIFFVNAETFDFLKVEKNLYKKIKISKKDIKEKFKNNFLELLADKSYIQKVHKQSIRKVDFITNLKFKNENLYSVTFKFFKKNNLFLCVLSELVLDQHTSTSLLDDFVEFTYHAFIDVNFNAQTIFLSPEFAEKFNLLKVLEFFPKDGLKNIENNSAKKFMSNFDLSILNKLTSKTIKLYDKSNEVSYFDLHYIVIADERKRILRIIGRFEDVTNINLELNDLLMKSQVDLLTGLYNKITTEQKIEERLAKSKPNQKHALLIVDLDDFKTVNDTYGHRYGDIFIKLVSSILKENLDAKDIIGRMGGDEFLVLIDDYSNEEELIKKCNNLSKKLNTNYELLDINTAVKSSIGVAKFPEIATKFEDLYSLADQALYISKKEGKGTFTIYENLISTTNEEKVNSSFITKEFFCFDMFEGVYTSKGEVKCLDNAFGPFLKQAGFTQARIVELKDYKMKTKYIYTEEKEYERLDYDFFIERIVAAFFEKKRECKLYVNKDLESKLNIGIANISLSKLLVFKVSNDTFIILEDYNNLVMKYHENKLANVIGLIALYYKHNEGGFKDAFN